MSDSGWSEWSDARRMASRHLQLALESLKRLQVSTLPVNEKRIAAATYLECLLSSMAASLLTGDQSATVQDVLKVYGQIWFG